MRRRTESRSPRCCTGIWTGSGVPGAEPSTRRSPGFPAWSRPGRTPGRTTRTTWKKSTDEGDVRPQRPARRGAEERAALSGVRRGRQQGRGRGGHRGLSLSWRDDASLPGRTLCGQRAGGRNSGLAPGAFLHRFRGRGGAVAGAGDVHAGSRGRRRGRGGRIHRLRCHRNPEYRRFHRCALAGDDARGVPPGAVGGIGGSDLRGP